MYDSEQLFDETVKKCGGIRVTEIVAKVPSFENADYYFDARGVVAELKSLQKDFLTAAETERRMHQLFNKWVDEGKVPPAYGRLVIKTDELPTSCADELFDVFRIPLERILRKGERQIVATKKALKCPDALGLLCLANDGNLALDPQTSVYLLKRCLENAFPAIEHVLLFSANLMTNIKGVGQDGYLFASIRFPRRRQIPETLFKELYQAWHAVLEKTLGSKLVNYGVLDVKPSDVTELRFWRP
jgi:hypothetical protein